MPALVIDEKVIHNLTRVGVKMGLNYPQNRDFRGPHRVSLVWSVNFVAKKRALENLMFSRGMNIKTRTISLSNRKQQVHHRYFFQKRFRMRFGLSLH